MCVYDTANKQVKQAGKPASRRCLALYNLSYSINHSSQPIIERFDGELMTLPWSHRDSPPSSWLEGVRFKADAYK